MKINRKSMARQMCILMAAAFFAVAFSFCKEKDDTLPVITAVRTTQNPDSTFTGSFPGQLIVILGENLKETTNIWFNNVEAEFNPNYRTNTSVIVSIPANIPLRGTDKTAPNEIRLTTPYGTTVYSFSFYSPEPAIELLIFDIPAVEGAGLTIKGSNFYEVQKIVFRNVIGSVETTEFRVGANDSTIVLNFPAGSTTAEAIDVVCVSGTATKEFSPDPLPVVRSVSSDMPVVGSDVVIFGEYFHGVEKIMLPNGVVITEPQFNVNDTRSEITFKMPALTPTQGGKLTVVIREKTYEVPGTFYAYEQVLVDFDTNTWGWSWGRENLTFEISPSAVPYVSTGKVARVAGTPVEYWWGDGTFYLGSLTSLENGGWKNIPVPEDTPLENVVLKFNFYTESAFNKGGYRIELGRWEDVSNQPDPEVKQVLFRPYYDATQLQEVGSKPGKWVDYEIPLTWFNTDMANLKTYGDFVRSRTNPDLGVYFTGGTEDVAALGTVNIFFDNFRLVVK